MAATIIAIALHHCSPLVRKVPSFRTLIAVIDETLSVAQR